MHLKVGMNKMILTFHIIVTQSKTLYTLFNLLEEDVEKMLFSTKNVLRRVFLW